MLSQGEPRDAAVNFDGGLRKTIFPKTSFRTFKFIQGHTDFGINRKRVCDSLLVRHRNLGPILHRFRDIAGFCAHDPRGPLKTRDWKTRDHLTGGGKRETGKCGTNLRSRVFQFRVFHPVPHGPAFSSHAFSSPAFSASPSPALILGCSR